MSRRGAVAGLLAAVGLVAGGCGTDLTPSPEPDVTSSAPERETEPAPEPTTEPGATDAPMEEITGGEPNPTAGPPEWDAAAEEAAAAQAEAFMRAFARPDLPAEEWLAGIAGFLSDQGQQLFAYVEPANVPASELTGEVEVLENQAPTLAEVHVGTDAGTYLVTLTRLSQDQRWLVEYAEPVES